MSDTQTGIRLTSGFFFLAFLLYFVKPQVSIDGGPPIPVKWGESFVPTSPGPHQVKFWFKYLFKDEAGKAEKAVDAARW